MRKQWLFVALLIGVLAVAITAGTALAQSNEGSGTSPIKSFAARMAEKLGLQEAQVQDAMKQAAKEMHDERLKARLDAAVAAGKLTQEEADEIYAWFQARPDVIGPMMGKAFGHFGGHNHRHDPRHGGLGMEHMPVPAPAPTTPEATSAA
ncbi:MAG: hypothetical protein HY681_06010 [Chloroflexi bacterium]|nr:hypothetical protein [Chloroflexota bacterium]